MTDNEKPVPEKPKGTIHPYAGNIDVEDIDGVEDTTWAEVCRTCCCHPPAVWAIILLRLFFVVFFLFFFILGLEILGDGAQVLTGCAAGALFSDDMNPVSGLMIGILVTCLLQSSSTTTSIIVTLVGAGAIDVSQGIYMVMGANIGTSVTNTIVAMGQMGDGDELERAFAGATVHDMFNFLSVALFFPLEVISGFLEKLTAACVKNASTGEGDTRDGFVKKWIEPLGKLLIIVNKSVTKDVAQGGSCDDFYPTACENPEQPTYSECTVGLIACDKSNGKCPALFQSGATQTTDVTSGLVAFIVGITLLFICLGGLVTVLQQMLLGASTRIIYKATDINGYLAMLIGCGITVAVQSSSITTSTLTPLVGMGLIRLEQML
jgi:sodium-dependent phosphate cotransporter